MPSASTLLPRAARRLRLTGRIDAHVVRDVEARLDTLPTGDVELDLAEVRFLDGAVLNALDERRRRLHSRGHDLRITAASTAATVILELASTAGLLEGPAFQATLGGDLAVAA